MTLHLGIWMRGVFGTKRGITPAEISSSAAEMAHSTGEAPRLSKFSCRARLTESAMEKFNPTQADELDLTEQTAGRELLKDERINFDLQKSHVIRPIRKIHNTKRVTTTKPFNFAVRVRRGESFSTSMVWRPR